MLIDSCTNHFRNTCIVKLAWSQMPTNYVSSKHQMSDSIRKWAVKNSSGQFLWIKLMGIHWFPWSYNEWKMTSKGKLGLLVQIHVCHLPAKTAISPCSNARDVLQEWHLHLNNRNSLAAKSKEWWLYLQATEKGA